MTEPQRVEIKYKTARPHLDLVCEALQLSHGLVGPAAKRLQMDPSNLRKYIRAHSRCFGVIGEAREKVKDLAESKLFESLNERDWRAIQFTLLTLGKDRGYVLPKGTPLNNEVTNNLVIQSVTIKPIESGKWLDPAGAAGTTIEGQLAGPTEPEKGDD
jgi:hypothetical protein